MIVAFLPYLEVRDFQRLDSMKITDSMKKSMLKTYLFFKTRPKKIGDILGKMEFMNKEEAPGITLRERELEKAVKAKKFTAGAVQMKWKLIGDPADFVSEMYNWAFRAARQGVNLLVFPEDIGLQLLGLIPGIEGMAGNILSEENSEGENSKGKSCTCREEETSGYAREMVREVVSFMTPVALRLYTETFTRLARRFKMYVMGGSIILEDRNGKIYNRAYLFGPGGKIVGYQEKLHLLPIEASWGLATGNQLRTFDTPLGKLSLPVCMDATYFETFRILELKGVEVVLLPTANPEEYNFWKALRGIWPRIQESRLYGIKSAMVGEFLGLKFTGKAGIYAPRRLTEFGDGILAEADTFDKEELVVAELDLNRLRNFREQDQIQGRPRGDVLGRYLPGLYQDGGEHFQPVLWPR